MNWQFVTLRPGTSFPARETFEEAFTDMFLFVKREMKAKMLTYQELETAIWIENGKKAMYFCESRDCACRSGLMERLLTEHP